MVELSIVLGIIALLIGTSVSLGSARINVEKARQTQQKMEVIIENLKRYISTGGNYIVNGVPCPARADLPDTNAAFGVEDCVSGSGAFANGIYIDGGQATFRVGQVPNRTILLPDEYVYDGWGNKFDWVMDTRYRLGSDLQGGAGTETNLIEIRPTQAGAAITQSAIFMIMSHGPSGHGAWKKNGSSRIDKNGLIADVDKIENTLCNAGVAVECDGAAQRVFVIKAVNSTFDDIAIYKMRWQLIPAVTGGGIIRHPIAACNRPNPSAAGTDQTYACPTDPRNCVPAAMGNQMGAYASRFVNNGVNGCTNATGCWEQYEARNETNTAIGSDTYRYMCIAPDGSPVLCKATVSALADGVAMAPETWLERNATVTPNRDNTVGDCIWWQY